MSKKILSKSGKPTLYLDVSISGLIYEIRKFKRKAIGGI